MQGVLCLLLTFGAVFSVPAAQHAPDPPTNLSVSVLCGKVAEASWEPPRSGGHTGYKLSVVPRSEQDKSPQRNHIISHEAPFLLRGLTPGAAYEVQLVSVFHKRQSALTTSYFTTNPNTPGPSIARFRNETSLLFEWLPPNPSGVFDRYRVSVSPEDSRARSQLFVAKKSDPSDPARAGFYGLVPGRAYTISVQTVSGDQESDPSRVEYGTIPLPPVNVKWDPDRLSSVSFNVHWDPPTSLCVFDRYQVSLGNIYAVRYIVAKEEERVVTFDDALDPGETYKVMIKTYSGKMGSWPAVANITTRPLPVTITSSTSDKDGEISLSWEPAKNSTQDSYEIKYHDLEAFNSVLVMLVVRNTSITLTSLLPGRNYSVSVTSISKRIPSESVTVYHTTWNENCPFPGVDPNGKVVVRGRGGSTPPNPDDVFPPGTSLLYTCNRGYTRVGTSDNFCKPTGEWSDSNGSYCISNDSPGNENCPFPGVDPNGKVFVRGRGGFTPPNLDDVFPPGTRLLYTCNRGYTRVGTSDNFCKPTGEWSDSYPSCNSNDSPVKECSFPGVDPNGEVVVRGQEGSSPLPNLDDVFLPGTHLLYTCNEGYTMKGPSDILCMPTGEWSDIYPYCNSNESPGK